MYIRYIKASIAGFALAVVTAAGDECLSPFAVERPTHGMEANELLRRRQLCFVPSTPTCPASCRSLKLVVMLLCGPPVAEGKGAIRRS